MDKLSTVMGFIFILSVFLSFLMLTLLAIDKNRAMERMCMDIYRNNDMCHLAMCDEILNK